MIVKIWYFRKIVRWIIFVVDDEYDRENNNGDEEVPMGNIGYDHEGNWNMSEDMMDINDCLNEENEGSTCVGDNQDDHSDTRWYLPVRKDIIK